MALAGRLKWYLESHEVPYDVVHHEHAGSSLESGLKARIPPGRVAKCVLLEDELGYLLAIVPSPCRVSFAAVQQLLHRSLELASEAELNEIFVDCEPGAIPAVGEPYNVPMLVDETLLQMPDLYFEGGDHEELVHLTAQAFKRVIGKARHGRIGRRDTRAN